MDPGSKNRRVLVTGATGFIGSNLARKLLNEGYEVYILARKSSSLWRIADIKDRLRIFNATLEDFGEIDRAVSEIKPEIIFHLATYGGFSDQKEPDKIIDTDVIGTMNLFKACLRQGFSLFVNTGSSSEYGLKEHPMSEQDELMPITYYGATKAAMSQFFSRIAKSQNLNIVTLRPFAVYGYYEEKERLVPHIIISSLKNWEPRLSTPTSVRDFVFVEDVVEAYIATIGKKEIAGECFNIGSGQQHSIGELARLAIELCGKKLRAIYGTRPSTQTVEPSCWVADISKAEKLLGWKPKHSLREGLTKSIDWFRKNTALYED